MAFQALKHSYNFVAKHWDYFQEIGIIQKDSEGRIGVTNALIFALYDVAMSVPPDTLALLVDTDPLRIVRIAQRLKGILPQKRIHNLEVSLRRSPE